MAHPQCSECLKNIQLEFLPVNTTSLVQAMDMGIIKNLKMLFRGKLGVSDSWREIGSKTIQNCFYHCSLKHSGLDMPETAKS